MRLPRWTAMDWLFVLLLGMTLGAVLATGCAPQRMSDGSNLNLRR